MTQTASRSSQSFIFCNSLLKPLSSSIWTVTVLSHVTVTTRICFQNDIFSTASFWCTVYCNINFIWLSSLTCQSCHTHSWLYPTRKPADALSVLLIKLMQFKSNADFGQFKSHIQIKSDNHRFLWYEPNGNLIKLSHNNQIRFCRTN